MPLVGFWGAVLVWGEDRGRGWAEKRGAFLGGGKRKKRERGGEGKGRREKEGGREKEEGKRGGEWTYNGVSTTQVRDSACPSPQMERSTWVGFILRR